MNKTNLPIPEQFCVKSTTAWSVHGQVSQMNYMKIMCSIPYSKSIKEASHGPHITHLNHSYPARLKWDSSALDTMLRLPLWASVVAWWVFTHNPETHDHSKSPQLCSFTYHLYKAKWSAVLSYVPLLAVCDNQTGPVNHQVAMVTESA